MKRYMDGRKEGRKEASKQGQYRNRKLIHSVEPLHRRFPLHSPFFLDHFLQLLFVWDGQKVDAGITVGCAAQSSNLYFRFRQGCTQHHHPQILTTAPPHLVVLISFFNFGMKNNYYILILPKETEHIGGRTEAILQYKANNECKEATLLTQQSMIRTET